MVPRFGDQSYESFVEGLRGLPAPEHRQEGSKESRGDLFGEFLEEFGRDAVAFRCFALGHRGDGVPDFLQSKILVSSWFVSVETRVGVLVQHASRAFEVPGASASEV
ncbi:unnamed protein product [Sphagnum troendelagicum]|uniref:Uncharacterized protein n=1 Tax=Sphagnum troendelagicum TaxID=128251 RepID=A0ABP0V6B5_9BRYO